MICANCGTHNEPGTRFCDECGASLAAPCPNCGSSNRPNAKFCATCGTALGTGTADVGEGTEAVPSSGRALAQSERRLVSVLFVDLVGFTPFAEERDPEQVRDTLDRYFAIARLAIERHGGTIEKFIGDAVMAVWGTPTAHEDDAERAVRAALELVESVHELGPGIDSRAGIMTGDAAVTIGAEGQGMVAGDLVNTASRLQSVAPAGSVLVSETTMRAAEAAVTFEPVGEQQLKGKSVPVQAFRAIRVVANRGGGSRAEGLEAPFVGRDEELRQLKEVLHATSRDRRVRLVSITGPAGIGKSRLTWEFEKYIDGLVETIFWHRGRSPAYGEGVTFWALGEMVRRRAQLSESDDEATTRERIHASVVEFVDDADEREWIEPALLTLLGVDPAPPGGRDALFAAWRIYLERIAARGTTALVFEDLQWADDGLLDFIEYVLEWSKNLPLLIISLSRPDLFDRRPRWASGQRFMTALALEPLNDDDMRQLLDGLAPNLPDKSVREILRRADGIPLYAVEIVRMLVADGKLGLVDGAYRASAEMGELAVPETLRSLIASRLDALDPADRGLLQDAAVLGQRFTLAALAAISGATVDALEPRLRALARREFADMESDPRSPERGQYGFVQSLIREVAYGTLSRRDRRTRHLAAARYFETLGDEELAGALATHYLAAHEASAEGPERDAVGAQARLALRAAGERAAALGAHEQAVTFLTQALEVTTEPVDRAALLVSLADSANPSGMHELAESSARDALALYQAAGAEDAAMHAAAVLGRILIDVGKLHEAGPALEHALLQRGKSGDDEASAAVLASLARIYMRLNENERAVAAADRALLAAELVDARTTIAEALVNKGTALGGLGRTFEGRVLLQAGVDLAAELGIIELRLRGLNNLGAAWMEDDPKRSLDTVMASIEIADLMGQAGIGNWQIGAAAMYQLSMGEDWARPVAMLEEMLSSAVTPHDVARGLAGLALFKVMQGKDARGALDAARAAAVGVDEVQMSAAINWAEALLAYSEGDYGAAMARADEAIELWHNFGVMVLPIAIRSAVYGQHTKEFDAYLGTAATAAGHGGVDRAARTWVAAMDAAYNGRATEAARLFTVSAERYGKLGFHQMEAEAYLDAVRLLGDNPAAADWAAKARAIFERLEMKPFLALLDAAIKPGAAKKSAAARPTSVEVASEPA